VKAFESLPEGFSTLWLSMHDDLSEPSSSGLNTRVNLHLSISGGEPLWD
jgi:hypothetical protein